MKTWPSWKIKNAKKCIIWFQRNFDSYLGVFSDYLAALGFDWTFNEWLFWPITIHFNYREWMNLIFFPFCILCKKIKFRDRSVSWDLKKCHLCKKMVKSVSNEERDDGDLWRDVWSLILNLFVFEECDQKTIKPLLSCSWTWVVDIQTSDR